MGAISVLCAWNGTAQILKVEEIVVRDVNEHLADTKEHRDEKKSNLWLWILELLMAYVTILGLLYAILLRVFSNQ